MCYQSATVKSPFRRPHLGVLAVELADPGDPTVYTGVLQHVLQAAHVPVFIRVLR
jgi:hypothetical protein